MVKNLKPTALKRIVRSIKLDKEVKDWKEQKTSFFAWINLIHKIDD